MVIFEKKHYLEFRGRYSNFVCVFHSPCEYCYYICCLPAYGTQTQPSELAWPQPLGSIASRSIAKRYFDIFSHPFSAWSSFLCFTSVIRKIYFYHFEFFCHFIMGRLKYSHSHTQHNHRLFVSQIFVNFERFEVFVFQFYLVKKGWLFQSRLDPSVCKRRFRSRTIKTISDFPSKTKERWIFNWEHSTYRKRRMRTRNNKLC